MEEIATPNPKLGNERQENGHLNHKAVKSEALPTLHVDDLDSEDEVLTIPEVKIHSARAIPSRDSGVTMGFHEKKSLGLSGSEKTGLRNGGDHRNRPLFGQRKLQNSMKTPSFHDDSDEDLLNV